MISAPRRHYPEYLMEGGGLGLFLFSACIFGTFLFHPDSPAARFVPDPMARRALMGVAMGLTAAAVIYSPWGQQSGAHINPSVTLTFFRIGTIRASDALFYALSHFIGAVAGVTVAALVIGEPIRDRAVNYLVTVPGKSGTLVAFLSESAISFVLMLSVLWVMNRPKLAKYTGLCVAFLIANYVLFVGPLSGFSMNPARTFGSALAAGEWAAWWVYFTAPVLGMLLAAEVHVRVRGFGRWACPKLYHDNEKRCIFCGKGVSDTITSVQHRQTG